MKKLLILIILLTVLSCSSDYIPSKNMLSIKKNMTTEQAIEVLQNQIWKSPAEQGVCASRGFWYDDESNMEVTNDKITMLAHKRGRQIKKLSHSFNDIVVFEKQYYHYEFIFEKIIMISIYQNPKSIPVFTSCNKKDMLSDYLIIDLFIDNSNNLKFIVTKERFDNTMAALTVLLPTKSLSFN